MIEKTLVIDPPYGGERMTVKAIWNLISKFEDDGTLNAKWGTKGFATFEEIRAAAAEARAMEERIAELERALASALDRK